MASDDSRSRFTGWTRDDWVALLARLTDGFVRAIPPDGSPAGAGLPGPARSAAVASIEGFARMSVAWAAWLHEPANRTLSHAGREHDVGRLLARGLADATDPQSPAWWGPMADRDQRIVEAAEIATALLLGGRRLRAELDAIDPRAHDRVLDWLALVEGRDVWPDNWVLFPMMSRLARRAAGRAIPDESIDDAIDWMWSHYEADGWYRDGDGHALDLYTGWAIHWHMLWWAIHDGGRRPRRRAEVIRRARAWLAGTAPVVAADGAYTRFGRSLGYRFAFAGPFVQAALLGIDPLPAGVTRRLASGVIRRALEAGAIDPATDWFRVGVGAARPEVVEGYVSTGASAWAAHALVGLALPADHPFWTAAEAPLPADLGRPGRLAGAGAGWVVSWDAAGATALHNGLSGHPSDIADHDYAATYGKLAYRSAFPFDVPVRHGVWPGAEDALVAEAAGTTAHRNETIAGSAGPRWTRSRYLLPTLPRPTDVATVVLLLDDAEVTVSTVRPGGAVRLRDGAAALGLDGDAEATEEVDGQGPFALVTDGHRVVAIRGLAGFDRAGISHTPAAASGLANLVHDRAIHPIVEEAAASHDARIVASAMVAATRPVDARRILAGLGATVGDGGRVDVAWSGGEASVVVGSRAPKEVRVGGAAFRGPVVRVAYVAADRSEVAGERLTAVDGIVTLARPGIVSVARDGAGVVASVESGITLDESWTGRPLVRLASRLGIGEWDAPIRLARPNVVPDDLVRRLARRYGTRLVTIRLEPEGSDR